MNEIIEISDDVNFNTGVTQLFNNDIANVWDRGKATQAEVDAEIKALNAVRAKLEYSTEDNETVVDETVATDTTKDETTDTVEDTKVPTTSDTTPLAIVFLLAMVGCACVLVRRKIIK